MRLSVMQPYFLPYIGYWQLIAASDIFIVYDNIKYTKKGWINRNRLLREGKDALFTIPLKSASDSLNVSQREVAVDFNPLHVLNQFREAYHSAPQYSVVMPLLQKIMWFESANLFHFIYHSIDLIGGYLGLQQTQIVHSSPAPIDHSLKGQDKVIALCEAVDADEYLNAQGGVELYSVEAFAERGIDLQFIRPKTIEYPQLGKPFVPWLSIVDVLRFNSREEAQRLVHTEYELFHFTRGD